MTEGTLYLFSLPSAVDKTEVTCELEGQLLKSKCGQILGSGMSLMDPGTISIEIGAYSLDNASEAVSRVLRKLKCHDYEMSWD